MAGKYKDYRTKIFVLRKGGVVTRHRFCVDGKNPQLRLKAELDSIVELKKLIIDEGFDYLVSYYKDEIKQEKRRK